MMSGDRLLSISTDSTNEDISFTVKNLSEGYYLVVFMGPTIIIIIISITNTNRLIVIVIVIVLVRISILSII